eukprot:gene8529-10023_t
MSNKPQRLHEEKFVIRLPDGMRERIALEARENARQLPNLKLLWIVL